MREMKDSGVEWIHDIPNNWTVMPNKYLMHKTKTICPVYNGEDILSLTVNGVVVRDLDAGGKMPTSFDGYQKVEAGNLLMCLFDIDVTPRCIGLINQDGLTSPAYSQFELENIADAAYYDYYYLMLDYDKTLLHLAKNLRHSLTEEQLGTVPTVVPPIEEQHAIADYLDRKCAEIDALTADIDTQIETLEQYKRSVITEAVTKGLDPDAEMKDSGVEWIGDIPSSWTVERLKYILSESMKYGANESGVDFDESLPRYIRITDIDEEGNLKNNGKLSLTESQANGYMLKDGAILFARSGATVGKAFMYRAPYGPAAFAGYLISAYINKNFSYPEWLLYFTQSSSYWDWVNRAFSQATIQNIGADKYSNMPIPVAPKEEQYKILKYLDYRCAEIDDIITTKRTQLEALAEYKKTVIYEYVTGKKEAPNA